MTAKEMRERIRALGLTVRVRDGEIRVNLRPDAGGSERTAYYTTEREDVVLTAQEMAGEGMIKVVVLPGQTIRGVQHFEEASYRVSDAFGHYLVETGVARYA